MSDSEPESNDSGAARRLDLKTILAGLTPGQAWSLAGAVVTVVLGAFGVGVFVESSRSESARLALEGRLEELRGELRETAAAKDEAIRRLEGRVAELEASLRVAANELGGAATRAALLEGKAEFLNRYVDYVASRNPVSKKLFADYVCVMWKESQERRLHIEREDLTVTAEDLQQGLSPEVRKLLEAHGIELAGKKADGGERRRVTRRVTRRAAPREGGGESVSITKTVRFFDGSSYTVPEPVAIEVHTRDDCVPR